MEYIEYINRLAVIENTRIKQKKLLLAEYVTTNNPHKVGDLVTDHIGSIIIDDIKVWEGSLHEPCAVYIGKECSKNGKIYKRGKTRHVFQTNLISN